MTRIHFDYVLIGIGTSMNKDNGLEGALLKFCRNISCTPEKLLKTAYGIRNFRSIDMDRLFIKTEMYLKSKSAAVTSMPIKTLGPRSRSSDVLPTSQSQINIQMISHTLTIREVKNDHICYCILSLKCQQISRKIIQSNKRLLIKLL